MRNDPFSPESLPRFVIGDDCLDAAQARLIVVHLHAPLFVVHVEFSAEQGTNVFHPVFLGDVSKLTAAAKGALVQEAVTFYIAAWRRAISPVGPS